MVHPKPTKNTTSNNQKQKKSKKKHLNNSLTLKNGAKISNKISLNKTIASVDRSLKGSKTSKAKSNISRDYLIVNETIYECENMEEVTEHMICG